MAAQTYKEPVRALNGDGRVLPGAALAFYTSGGLVPHPVYADVELTTPLANPLIADAAGRFKLFLLDPSIEYRAILTFNGLEIFDLDPLIVFPGTETRIPLNDNGAAMPFAQLTFWIDQTTQLEDIFDSNTLSVPLANPITADVTGQFPEIFLDEFVSYRVRLTDAHGVLIYDRSLPGEVVIPPPLVCDPDWANVVLFLPFDDGGTGPGLPTQDYSLINNTFVFDSLGKNSNSNPKFGPQSMWNEDGGVSGHCYTAPVNSALDLSSATHWTIEGWFNRTDSSGDPGILDNLCIYSMRDSSTGINIYFDIGTGALSADLLGSDAALVTVAAAIALDTYYHFAIVRNGGVVTAYLNGVGGTPQSITTDDPWPLGGLYIGTDGNTIENRSWFGYLDEFRVTRVARYTANFTPSLVALPAVAC